MPHNSMRLVLHNSPNHIIQNTPNSAYLSSVRFIYALRVSVQNNGTRTWTAVPLYRNSSNGFFLQAKQLSLHSTLGVVIIVSGPFLAYISYSWERRHFTMSVGLLHGRGRNSDGMAREGAVVTNRFSFTAGNTTTLKLHSNTQGDGQL